MPLLSSCGSGICCGNYGGRTRLSAKSFSSIQRIKCSGGESERKISEFILGESFPVFTYYMLMAHSLPNPSTCTVLTHFFFIAVFTPVAEMHIVQLEITLFLASVFGWKPALTENPAEGKRN